MAYITRAATPVTNHQCNITHTHTQLKVNNTPELKTAAAGSRLGEMDGHTETERSYTRP